MSTTIGATGASSDNTTVVGTPKPSNQFEGKETFLKLLVAQIRNQNPMQPADGMQFLSELSQFSQLEQLMDIKKNLDVLREQLAPAPTDAVSGEGK